MNTHDTQQFTGDGLTANQRGIVEDLCETHGLDPTQISFDGKNEIPIFDYEAVCALSLKLTDIAAIDSRILDPRTEPAPFGSGSIRTSIAECTVRLDDGRTRTCVDSAQLGETVAGVLFATPREADGLAQNRAVRRAIRSVGVNLWNAHRKFKETGEIASGSTQSDPRATTYAEIHVLAGHLELINDGDRTKYEQYISECFGGRTSSKALNDIELHQLLVQFRLMAGTRRANKAA